jgi:hypothetical protein
MTLADQLSALAQAIGADIKSLLSRVSVLESSSGAGSVAAISSADQSSSSTTLADATGLSVSVAANATYRVDAFVKFSSASVDTGLALGYTLPASAVGMVEIAIPSVSTWLSQMTRLITSAQSDSATGNGVPAADTVYTARISGIIKTGATSGALQIRFASEVASSAVTLKSGSEILLTRAI